MKPTICENLSTIKKIESNLLVVLGRPKKKPMLKWIDSVLGVHSPVLSELPSPNWQIEHLFINLFTSLYILGQ